MAKFLDTQNITAAIGNIIKKANERVILISPYIDFDKRYKLLIEEKNNDGVYVTIVSGKKEKQLKFNDEIKKWIKSMKYINHIFQKELHAKCYLNENEALITSMNLYKASQENNEMGILITKKEDTEAYTDLLNEVKRIIEKDNPNFTFKEGFCIRCKTSIKFDPLHPYCKKDYQVWSEFKKKDYEEIDGVCHICGEPNPSSLNKPVCLECYNKNKKLFKS